MYRLLNYSITFFPLEGFDLFRFNLDIIEWGNFKWVLMLPVCVIYKHNYNVKS